MKATLNNRFDRLRQTIREAGIDTLFLTPGATFRYLLGHSVGEGDRLCILGIPADGKPVVVLPSLEEANWRDHVPFDAHVVTWEDTQGPAAAVAEAVGLLGPVRKAAVEPLVMRVQEYEALRKVFGDSEFGSADKIVSKLRLYKDSDESASIRRAAVIAEKALEETLKDVRLGVTERHLAGRLSSLLLALGGEGISFGPIVLSGPKSALPHGSPDERALRLGELLLIDFGTSCNGYHCDITRTFVLGKPDERTRSVYEAVKRGNETGVVVARPGATAHGIHHAAQDGFNKPEFANYFKHRTGHGLGLDIHEPPSVMDGNHAVLEPGMVFTVEPGLYLDGWGGVRIEDDVLITDTGHFCLTSFPRELRILGP